jgi:hypothetical protein
MELIAQNFDPSKFPLSAVRFSLTERGDTNLLLEFVVLRERLLEWLAFEHVVKEQRPAYLLSYAPSAIPMISLELREKFSLIL